jgi:hypothetical protein
MLFSQIFTLVSLLCVFVLGSNNSSASVADPIELRWKVETIVFTRKSGEPLDFRFKFFYSRWGPCRNPLTDPNIDRLTCTDTPTDVNCESYATDGTTRWPVNKALWQSCSFKNPSDREWLKWRVVNFDEPPNPTTNAVSDPSKPFRSLTVEIAVGQRLVM